MPAYDGRKAKIKGLWKRGDIFYARLKLTYPGEDPSEVRRVPLKATTVPEARKEQCKLVVPEIRESLLLGSVPLP
jgi:hypothetical protein